jgi:hypothetical protein
MLGALQRGLELLYRIDTALDVRDFLIDADGRDTLAPARAAREQLLVAENADGLELGLFVDARVLQRLEGREPARCLGDHLGDFLLTVEGVSHFVYLAWRARRQRPVTALELELQAEVDKYVTCLLIAFDDGGSDGSSGGRALLPRLFDDFRLEPGLDAVERERYLVANSNARAYAARLDGRYVQRGALGEMLGELRWFYRLGAHEKLAYIAKAA